MKEKICIVTGANAGIGKATAVGLAERGATVVMVCRHPGRAEAARQAMARRSGSNNLQVLIADLASQAQVRRLAAEILAQYPRIDVLINNAAVIPLQRTTTEDGLELQLAVNHLAPFLLTNLLLDRLQASAPSRIVNVSSGVHRGAEIPFEDLQSERRYHPARVYAMTKLMNVLFTRELARRLAGSGVTANALHPGVPATKLSANYSGREGQERASFADLMAAAQTSLYVATSPEAAGVSGEYFSNGRLQSSHTDPAAAQKLWQISAQLTGFTEQ